VFLLYAHAVFVAKYRHRMFTAVHLEQIMRVCADFGCEVASFNGGPRPCPSAGELHPSWPPTRLTRSCQFAFTTILKGGA